LRNAMSKLLIVLWFELLIAVLFGQGGFLYRRDFNHAVFAWHQNPTPETKLELDRQRHINELYRWRFSAVAFGGMAIVTLLAGYTYKRCYRSARRTAILT
jgi:hypothetical protein